MSPSALSLPPSPNPSPYPSLSPSPSPSLLSLSPKNHLGYLPTLRSAHFFSKSCEILILKFSGIIFYAI